MKILGMLFIVIICSPLFGKNFEIIAHRGASEAAPENTKAAFMQAWKTNCDGAECDIHLTKDHRLIVMHDSTTKRTTGLDLSIKDCNSDELGKLDAGKFKGERFTGEKVPFLEDIIKTVPPQRKMFIEIKCGQEALPFLKNVIEKSGKQRQLVIIGFDLDTMTEAKKILPETPVFWLLSPEKDKKTEEALPYDSGLIDLAKKAAINGLDVDATGVTPEFVWQMKHAGLKLYVWTVDDINEVRRLRDMGVDGVTTNKTDILQKSASVW